MELITPQEIEEIKASNYWFGRESTKRLVDTIETLFDLLTESLDYAQHTPGCSGGITKPDQPGVWVYQCKCWYRQWETRVRKIIGEEVSNDSEQG